MFLQYSLCVSNLACQIQYTYWWWEGGDTGKLSVSRTLLSKCGRTGSTPPPHLCPPTSNTHNPGILLNWSTYSLQLGRGVEMYKNRNFSEDGSISKKCFPRTSLHDCKLVRYLYNLNKNAVIFTLTSMVFAWSTI